MKIGLLLIFICSQLFIGCSKSSIDLNVQKYSVETRAIYLNSIKSHELIVYGNKIDKTIFPEAIYIRKADNKNKEVKYEPIDQASLESSGFDLTYAWSPKGDYLVLPRGRFEGFTVFSTKELPEVIVKRSGKYSIAIKDTVGSKWWHEFIGWKNNDTIIFQAGLSNDYYTFEWNVTSGTLLSLDLKNGEYNIDK